MAQKQTIVIKTETSTFSILEGTPVFIKWKSKLKDRQGVNVAIGWILPGENRHSITLVHSTFETWDNIEQEYTSKWTVWMKSILEIRQLKKL